MNTFTRDELDALRLTPAQRSEWEQEWEDDWRLMGRPGNRAVYELDFKERLLREAVSTASHPAKPLRMCTKHTREDGVETLMYSHRPPSDRLIHGVASTPAINSNRVSRSSKGCRIRFPLPLFCSHAKIGEPIGDVVSVRLSEREIYAKAEIFHNPAGDFAWQLIEEGEVCCFSAGSADNKVQGLVDGVSFINSWRMRELSICRRGANPDCRFEIMK